MKSNCCNWFLILTTFCVGIVESQYRIWSCNFEEVDACGATLRAVGDNVKFSFNKGSTPSEETGPVTDNTLKTPDGTYIYLEATGRKEGDQAIMDTPNMPTGQAKCLEFYYHMYCGSLDHQGSIVVEALPDNKIFEVAGNQGDKWNLVRLDLKEDVEKVLFRAIRGPRYQSDIAIDDIFITSGGCKTGTGFYQPGQETFPRPSPPNQEKPQVPENKPDFTPPGGETRPERNPNLEVLGPDFQADLPEFPAREDPPRTNGPPSLPLDPRATPFQVRLISGRSQNQGRLEVLVNGKWGTVCHDGWTDMESFAACRSLGLSAGELGSPPESARLLSTDKTPIWLDGVRCSPGSRLDDCCRNEFGVHDCDHAKDVYLNCGSAAKATTTARPCPPGSTDCRPALCNPQLGICLPQPPRTPDPPGVTVRTPLPTRSGQGVATISTQSPRTAYPPPPASPVAPPPPSSAFYSGRKSNKSDFNLDSPDINGLNFSNDGNFKYQFRVLEEIKPIGGSNAETVKWWMELYSTNGPAYSRLKSRTLDPLTAAGGCIGYRILTAVGTTWVLTIGNEIGRQELASGAGRARNKPELILTPIKPSSVTRAPFNIYFEAWVTKTSDLFAVDDVTFYTGACPTV